MEFVHPYVLLSIPFLLLLFWYFRFKGILGEKRLIHPSVEAGQAEQLKKIGLLSDKLRKILLFLAFFTAIVAAAYPVGERAKKEKRAEVHKIFILLDVSGSMSGNSLKTATKIAKKFVRSRKGDLMGIIPFDNNIIEEYMVPLTTDTEYLKWDLDKLSEFMGGATAIGEAIFRGITELIEDSLPKGKTINPLLLRANIESQTVNEYTIKLINQLGKMDNTAIIILTDSGNNVGIDPIKVLALLHPHRISIKVYAIRVDVVEDGEFQRAVKRTGGKAYRAEKMAEVKQCFNEIDKLEKKKEIISWVPYKKPLARYPLAVSLICLFLWIILEIVYIRLDEER